jgi:hypothetical protein
MDPTQEITAKAQNTKRVRTRNVLVCPAFLAVSWRFNIEFGSDKVLDRRWAGGKVLTFNRRFGR